MNFNQYLNYFQEVIDNTNPQAPYDDNAYLDYTKLNWSRVQRWLKTGVLNTTIINKIKSISTPQNWLVITEPWCGDAAHIVPFIELMSKQNNLINVTYELRDMPPHSIEKYLTNGKSKSIPILVIRNENNEDLNVWGPRPKACQEHYNLAAAKNLDFDAIKIEIQNWYNQNKGEEIMNEIASIL